MAHSVDGRSVDPVDAKRDRVPDRSDRVGVVLASPAVGPTSTTDRPGTETDLSDPKTARSERTPEQAHEATSFARLSADDVPHHGRRRPWRFEVAVGPAFDRFRTAVSDRCACALGRLLEKPGRKAGPLRLP